MVSRVSLVLFASLVGVASALGQSAPTPTRTPPPTPTPGVTLDLTIPAPTPLVTPTPSAKPTPTKAPVPAATDPKKETIPAIPGLTLTRGDGRFLGVEMQGVQMKVTFYDAKKKKVAADAVRISAHWRDVGKDRNTVLLPGAPEVLISPAVLRKPHDYRVTLVLMGPDDTVLETFHVNLLSLPKGAGSGSPGPG